MQKRRLADAWTSFNALIVPATASDLQRREMKRAFYAGAGSIMDCIMGNLDPEKEVTEADDRMMEDIMGEISAFAAAIGRGEA